MPKKDVVKICQIAEKEMSIIWKTGLSKPKMYSIVIYNSFKNISRDILKKFDNNVKQILTCDMDRYSVIKMCIEIFLKLSYSTSQNVKTTNFKKI